MTPRCREAQGDLKGVIDQPLEGRQRANHGNANRQSIPEASEADIAIYPRDGRACTLAGLTLGVELRYHDVRGMGDHGAADAGDVAAKEGDRCLLQRIV
jgi:hypothetical protein